MRTLRKVNESVQTEKLNIIDDQREIFVPVRSTPFIRSVILSFHKMGTVHSSTADLDKATIDKVLAKYTPIPSKYDESIAGYMLNLHSFTDGQAEQLKNALITHGFSPETVRITATNSVRIQNHDCEKSGGDCGCPDTCLIARTHMKALRGEIQADLDRIVSKYTPVPTKYWTIINSFQLSRPTSLTETQATQIAEVLIANGYPRNTVYVLPEYPTKLGYHVLLGRHDCSSNPCESCKED
jgi:hypothetical protein